MRTVNVHEAKTHLSELLAAVERGESIIIARAGHPVARLVQIATPTTRPLGTLSGKFTVPDDFDQWASNEAADDFEGRT